ncbi:MAG: endonuclease III [Ruminococcaceae bacterium]|nr:endonuclease III [Oscillospiraceae bacterium]
MKNKIYVGTLIKRLKSAYPLAETTLNFDNAWQLMVSVRLAAQCTDLRVNEVTKILFKKYPSIEALAGAPVEDIAEIVRPCGLGNVKARDISLSMNMLIDKYDKKIPDDMDELLKIPGVGRKSANLLLGDIFGKPAIVADTHCIRLSGRLGLTASKNPQTVEFDLRKIIPPEESNDFCHRLVLHGRAVCTARSPKCHNCFLSDICPYGKSHID